ncbi:PREDICTED: cathepsin L1-like [Drosophila arizonae]|uniref:Cathepsin L1-like n=1 Tax=Drosophila arizonae TaxID=7263 RepID=A0ABM1PBU5_DROAR|nr:PREDICTED: cathepsin L1-like [Drosophila arizonae]
MLGIKRLGFYQLETEWNSYKSEFGKIYDESEERLRKLIFGDNKKIIEAHNERWAAGDEGYEMGLNQFSDMLPNEVSEAIGTDAETGFDEDVEVDMESYDWSDDENFELSPKVNWTQLGAVSPVAFQGHFNTSWAFAAAGVTESRQFIKSGKLQVLSKQNLVDCCKAESNWLPRALVCIKKMGGIDTEASYHYRGLTGKCQFKKKSVAARINKVFKIYSRNEKALAYSVSQGPIAAVIPFTAIVHYKSGVYDNPHCGQSANYAVLIVGYGHCKHFGDYWILKSSLSPHWGENGYMRLARNKKNLCGISNNAFFPEMK